MFGDSIWVGDCEGEGVRLGGNANVAGAECGEVEVESVAGGCQSGEEGEGFVGEHGDGC